MPRQDYIKTDTTYHAMPCHAIFPSINHWCNQREETMKNKQQKRGGKERGYHPSLSIKESNAAQPCPLSLFSPVDFISFRARVFLLSSPRHHYHAYHAMYTWPDVLLTSWLNQAGCVCICVWWIDWPSQSIPSSPKIALQPSGMWGDRCVPLSEEQDNPRIFALSKVGLLL